MRTTALIVVWLLVLGRVGGAQDKPTASPPAHVQLNERAAAVFRAMNLVRNNDPEAALTKLREVELMLDQTDISSDQMKQVVTELRLSLAKSRREIGRTWPTAQEIERRLEKNTADAASIAGYAQKLSAEVKDQRPSSPNSSLATIMAYHDKAQVTLEHGRQLLQAAEQSVTDANAKVVVAFERRQIGKLQKTFAQQATRLAQEARPFPNREHRIDELIDYEGLCSDKLAGRLEKAQEHCQAAETRILLIATDADSRLTRQLVSLRHLRGDEFEFTRELFYAFVDVYTQYRFVWASSKSRECHDLLEKYKLPKPTRDEAAFVVLDGQGALIAASSSADLQTNGKFDSLRLVEFMRKHVVDFANRDAEQLLQAAFAEAKRDGKKVLLQVGGPGCAPCILLKRYMLKQQALINKDYVYVTLDARMANQRKALSRVDQQISSIPWFAILDADEKLLVTSRGPYGNVGFPNDPEGIRHFETMLRSTCRQLKDAEIKHLIADLTGDGE